MFSSIFIILSMQNALHIELGSTDCVSLAVYLTRIIKLKFTEVLCLSNQWSTGISYFGDYWVVPASVKLLLVRIRKTVGSFTISSKRVCLPLSLHSLWTSLLFVLLVSNVLIMKKRGLYCYFIFPQTQDVISIIFLTIHMTLTWCMLV